MFVDLNYFNEATESIVGASDPSISPFSLLRISKFSHRSAKLGPEKLNFKSSSEIYSAETASSRTYNPFASTSSSASSEDHRSLFNFDDPSRTYDFPPSHTVAATSTIHHANVSDWITSSDFGILPTGKYVNGLLCYFVGNKNKFLSFSVSY